jgi:capsular exopolysaccharide synthesis family protein
MLITNPKTKSPVVEAYKVLRTNIQFLGMEKQLKVILITSTNASEGKSTTASNLAITMAQADKRTLLMDCDLRKPSIHRPFGLLNEKGITNVLAEGLDFHTVCNSVGVQNLDVLTSGPKPPNPPELLGSSKMQAFIKIVAEEYDVVIIDAPPVLPVTDAAVLSVLADGVILVISYGETSNHSLIQAKETLEKVDANIIGTIINNTPTKGYRAYSYYYYYNDDDNSSRRKSARHSKKASAKLS